MTLLKYMTKFLLPNAFGLAATSLFIGMSSCTNIDCPLDNQVEMVLNFYSDSTKKAFTLTDTLSVYGLKGDTTQLLFNRAIGQRTIRLPLNVASDRDTLLLRYTSASAETASDTLFVTHQPKAHFESLDCPASVFHTLAKVEWRAHNDSTKFPTVRDVLITNPNVAYENVEHLKVFLRRVGQ